MRRADEGFVFEKGLRFRGTTQAALATAVMIWPSFARHTVRSAVARRLIT
jgi:hypothetical protein